MSKMQRTKGATWERELARYLTAQGLPAKRGIGQARSASEVPDVDLPGYWVEAKRHAKTSPRGALAQAVRDSEGSRRVPVAICRDNGTSADEAMVTMRLCDWVVMAACLAATREVLAGRGDDGDDMGQHYGHADPSGGVS